MSDETTETRNLGGRPKRARGAATSSAEAGPAWSIRGVAPNVRAIANRAATARGATVGDWVSEAIVRHARAVLGELPEDLAGEDSPPIATLPATIGAPAEGRPLDERLLIAIERNTREVRRQRMRRYR